jgi:3-methyladenine DNA glycosylase AlkD
MGSLEAIIAEHEAIKNPERAAHSLRFFKTGRGEYGDGDLFLGVRVPVTRTITKKYYQDLTTVDLNKLLHSKWHELRLSAVVAMALQYKKADENYKKDIYNLYLKNIGQGINNWDIVDVSCAHIVGAYLWDKDRSPLYELAKQGLWHKRTSIISTFYFLRKGDPADTYKLAELLVNEQHDLLQKAVGWSLREMGKVDSQLLRQFLNTYAATMPRTALRYALEKLPVTEKQHYMSLKNK